MLDNSIETQNVIGVPVTALPFEAQINWILKWGRAHLSKVVCVANVHMLTEASWDSRLASVLETADLVTPDGMPLVWMLRLLTGAAQDRVAGLDIMLAVCQQAEREGLPVFLRAPIN
ncbi:MAG: hypothetical protein B0A82_02310 [Alkalinema sp. CACIAM 70d]|nr:MAG: hypothetical protein B0A82_02310 [Alkalinema sp. CACIAM 70d]